MKKLTFAILAGAAGAPALAAVDLSELLGFTLIEEKTVVGYIEDGEYEDGYQGCRRGRILVFQDETGVICAEHNFDFAFRPTAFIFERGSSLKVVIDDEVMDARHVR
jgi:hypothetical protein